MSFERRFSAPRPLLASALSAAGQGVFFLGYAALELLHLTDGRVVMGLTTTIFFALWGGGLMLAAWGLARARWWALSPVVLTQLITLFVAWGFRGGSTTIVAILAGGVSLMTLAGLFAPSSSRVLGQDRKES
ncbi:MAG: hypothetical protein ACRCYQ_02915 [Nocardioides sp.]